MLNPLDVIPPETSQTRVPSVTKHSEKPLWISIRLLGNSNHDVEEMLGQDIAVFEGVAIGGSSSSLLP